MKRIEWQSNMTPDQQELNWMREFVKKSAQDRFSFICKLQLMEIPKDLGKDKKGKRIEWI